LKWTGGDLNPHLSGDITRNSRLFSVPEVAHYAESRVLGAGTKGCQEERISRMLSVFLMLSALTIGLYVFKCFLKKSHILV